MSTVGPMLMGEPAQVAVLPEQLHAAWELVDGRGIKPGREAAKAAELVRALAQHRLDGHRLPRAIELRFAELVLLLAANSASTVDGGS